MTDRSETSGDAAKTMSNVPVYSSSYKILFVIGENPFVRIGITTLSYIPRHGDLLEIPVQNGITVSSVSFIRHTFGNIEHDFVVGVVYSEMRARNPNSVSPEEKSPMDALVDFHSKTIERSTNYNNLVLAAGYAGLFVIWSYSKDFMSAKGMALAAFLIGVSIIVFSAHQVFSAWSISKISVKAGRNLNKNPEQFMAIMQEAEVKQRQESLRNSWLWAISFYVSVPFGFLAGIVLMYNAVARLLAWPQWP